jgi:hypothetical protein
VTAWADGGRGPTGQGLPRNVRLRQSQTVPDRFLWQTVRNAWMVACRAWLARVRSANRRPVGQGEHGADSPSSSGSPGGAGAGRRQSRQAPRAVLPAPKGPFSRTIIR